MDDKFDAIVQNFCLNVLIMKLTEGIVISTFILKTTHAPTHFAECWCSFLKSRAAWHGVSDKAWPWHKRVSHRRR